MSLVVISLFLIGIVSLILFFTGCIDAGINFLIRRAYERHKQTRWNQRPSRIFLVRHGESEANVDTTLYARMADSRIELTERGHQQAIEAGEKIRSIIGKESVYAYMSPYRRSKQTWTNIKKAFSPLQVLTEREDPRIREQEFGNIAVLPERAHEFEQQAHLGHFFYRFSSGESGADVYDRVSLFLDTLFREMDNGHHDPTRNIVIVSHGLFMRLFLMRYFRWTVEEFDTIKDFGNCEICQLTKIDGVYKLNGHTSPPTESS
ncbi:unnamed protein product [Adineta steineri]|uniref:Phosphoglycerate mutase-like protein n=1 Tax=Adineta steineri TaxID=433720 RepID=A0A814C730_9BILA|nr:unnamed protein product [Adineta steineri]CAF1391251.1 unnamed protein product [Adineta steineri]CAF3536708.1 unnamed protein product [Adineta steineri]CAF3947807.1 unnamed protein product [Adineta steineri]